jgi:AcrR family transcriptional regulator
MFRVMNPADDSTPAARRRSTRDRPAKAPLSVEAVVDEALALLKSDGPDAVSMRRVAAALDTGAASLYVYVSGREGLVQAMLDRVVSAVELDTPDPSQWRDQLHALMERVHAALISYPGMASLTLADSPKTEAILGLAENMLGILLAGGVAAQDAAWACDILLLFATAAAREDDVRYPSGRDGRRMRFAEEARATFLALPPDRFPLMIAQSDALVAGDGRTRFRFAVDLVVDGLLARVSGR